MGTVLAERAAALLWRLHRMSQLEQAAMARGQRQAEEDVCRSRRAAQAALAASGRPPWPYPEHPADLRRLARSTRLLHELLRALPALPDTAPVASEVAAAAVQSIAEVAGVDGASFPRGILPPGVERGAVPDCTAHDLRLALDEIARHSGQDSDVLLARAREDACLRAEAAADEDERVTRDVNTRRALGGVPDPDAAEQLTRYETRLTNQVSQTIRLLIELRAARLDHTRSP